MLTRYTRALLFSYAVATALVAVLLCGSAWLALHYLTDLTNANRHNLAEVLIENEQDSLARLVTSESWWDDLIQHGLRERDPKWLETNYNQSYLADLRVDGLSILDGRDQPVHEVGETALSAMLPADLLGSMLTPVHQAELSESFTTSGLVTHQDRLVLVTAAAIKPVEIPPESISPDLRGTLLLWRELDRAALDHLAQHFGIPGLTFDGPGLEAAGVAQDDEYLALHDPLGRRIGSLRWSTADVLPTLLSATRWMLVLVLAFVVVSVVVFWLLVGILRQLGHETLRGERQARLLKARSLALERLARGETLDAVLSGLATSIEAVLPETRCLILETGEDRQIVRAAAARQAMAGSHGLLQAMMVDPAQRALEERFFRGDDLLNGAVADHPHLGPWLQRFGFGTVNRFSAMPVRNADHEVIGGIMLFTPLPEPFDAAALEQAHAAAQVVAVALERRQAEARLEALAYRDALTGLMNRTLFLRMAEHMLREHRRRAAMMALLFIDLDHFKEVNDSHGHATGDRLLVEVAGRLQSEVRESDLACRYAGDEFVVALADLGTAEALEDLVGRLHAHLSRPLRIEACSLQVGASIGVALAQPDDTLASLLERADQAMYDAKQAGRAGVRGLALH